MRNLNLSKDHLQPVGTVKHVNSDTYGTYVMTCIANISWFKHRGADDFMKWSAKYHPTRQGWAMGYGETPNNTEEFTHLSLFVALSSQNKEWASENPNCKYMQDMSCLDPKKKIKSLPVGASDRDIARWLDNSRNYILDV